MRTRGYSIWLIPRDKTFKRLSDLIKKLSVQYKTPHFEPHVTLLGGIIGSQDEIVDKTKELASKIRPYEIQLSGVDYLDYYFKLLFLKVKKARLVMGVNQKAREVFNMTNEEKYAPHLSLIYGNFLESVKKEIIKSRKLENLEFSFTVDRVHLYRTEGEVKDWRKIEEFPIR